jgi:alkanesulfonate monooxygenase SsuD/methylene tetrahydromethanopterin reductase-like flavin-dependent oxidoreductase (luciferase family)
MPSFEGRYYKIREAVNRPRPLSAEGPPILVGGSGERRTLRIVAKYADACNIFGDVETARHKLEVLARHCEEVGRDPSTITKSRLGTLVIAESEKEADSLVAGLASRRGEDEKAFRAAVTAGSPDQVVEQVDELFGTGLDALVFNLPNAYDLDTVALAGNTLTKAFGELQAAPG